MSSNTISRLMSIMSIALTSVVMVTAMTYGQEPGRAAWYLEVKNPRFIQNGLSAFTADLVVRNLGPGSAENVRIYLSYPNELFTLTDLHQSPTGWLPFLGGLPVKRWGAGESLTVEFGYRFDRRTREKVLSLTRKARIRILWTEGNISKTLELTIPYFEPRAES